MILVYPSTSGSSAMRYFLHPLALLSEAAMALGVYLGRLDVVLLGAIAWVGVAAWLGMRAARAGRTESAMDAVSNENRARIAPIQRVVREIEKIAAQKSNNPTIRVIGSESLKEANAILNQSVRLLDARTGILDALKGAPSAERDVEELRSRIGETENDERTALQSALDARILELEHYNRARAALQTIDRNLSQAEAALGEMRARLAVAAAGGTDGTGPDAELRESLERMKALQASFVEAEELAQGEGS